MPAAVDERAREVFEQVFDRAPAERATELVRACGGDAALRGRVEALLAAADKDDDFLREPALPLATESRAADQEQVGTCIGPYTLIELVGEGGFGTVFLAEQTSPVRRRVALKIIRAGMDTRRVVARFETERQTLALMEHPNIARVLEAGATASGRPYVVMEFVPGEPVTRYCDHQRLTLARRLELFRDICGAVQHAHQKGVIHRDLKPSNILASAAGGESLVKVIDFGIAKATSGRLPGEQLTGTHERVGTPDYMSPEQAGGGAADLDTRADIYSLGVLLYELLTGTTPFGRARLASSDFQTAARIILEEEPPRPSARVRSLGDSQTRTIADRDSTRATSGRADSSLIEISDRRRTEPLALARALRGDLDWIVLRCLEKDRARRYDTAAALSDDVARYLSDQPVVATPPSAAYRLRKFVRRNRGGVIAGAAVAAMFLVGTIGTSVGLVWALRERGEAREQRAIAVREAEQTEAVSDFMRQVLTSVDPRHGGADVRLRDVLAGASAGAHERFKGHPLLEADVRELLGAIYNNLTLTQLAAEEYATAADLARAAAGPDDPRVLSAEYRTASALLTMSRTADAERILSSLLPRLQRVLGPDDPTTLDVMRCHAISLQQRGNLDEAERILRALRANPRLAQDDASQVRILYALNLVQVARPRPSDPAARQAHWEGIAAVAEEQLERSLRTHGPHASDTLQARVSLVPILFEQERFAEAADMGRAILSEPVGRIGECNDTRAAAMFELAVVLGRLGESREPAELCLSAIECRRSSYPADSIPLLSMLNDSLFYLDRAGLADEGETIAREVTRILARYGGGHGDIMAAAEIFAAHFVSMAGRLDEAERLFEPLLASEESIASEHARARLQMCYAAHLVRRGEFEQAERHLNRAVELRGDAARGTWPGLPDDLLLALIRFYHAWNKPDRANVYECMREQVYGIATR